MRLIALLFLVCGVALAGGAIYYAKKHFDRMEAMMAQDEGPQTVRILAAKQPLAYSDRIDLERGREVLQWIEWPAESVPNGAFTTREEFLGQNSDQVRIVLRAIEPGELVLKNKVTGFGEGLRLQVSAGMRAVTIPIDTVSGGIGFIKPGDLVDIHWTRRTAGTTKSTILLAAVKVIATDQLHDTQSQSGPRSARTATVEVSPTNAQKLVLAMDAGKLNLFLLSAEEQAAAATSTSEGQQPATDASVSSEESIIDLSDLPGSYQPAPEPQPEPEPVKDEPKPYQPLLPGGRPVRNATAFD